MAYQLWNDSRGFPLSHHLLLGCPLFTRVHPHARHTSVQIICILHFHWNAWNTLSLEAHKWLGWCHLLREALLPGQPLQHEWVLPSSHSTHRPCFLSSFHPDVRRARCHGNSFEYSHRLAQCLVCSRCSADTCWRAEPSRAGALSHTVIYWKVGIIWTLLYGCLHWWLCFCFPISDFSLFTSLLVKGNIWFSKLVAAVAWMSYPKDQCVKDLVPSCDMIGKWWNL